jgi:hypothetical protein
MSIVNYFEPQRLWGVSQWRGQDDGHRTFGHGLDKANALKRAALVERLFPEYARCRVTPIDG